MKKVSVIGLFRHGQEIADGQSIKTRIIAREIEETFGEDDVEKIDTFGWKKHPFRLLANCIKAVSNSKNVIFLTDAGGINVFPWLLTCANVFKKRTIHYVVVGGWLIHFVKKHTVLTSFLKKLNGVFVETTVMKKALEDVGFENVYLMPNVKELKPLSGVELRSSFNGPYRFCVFSRIMKEKGIENAVNAVQNINSLYGKTVCTLDLYGQVDVHQTEWFKQLVANFPATVQYKGVVHFDKSIEVLKDYYALLFPTQFYTEGIPGTIIDAYASGLPVIASAWESVYDIVDNGKTGVAYPFEKPECLQTCMQQFIESPEKVFEMKKACLEKAKQYLPDVVMDTLLSKLD